MRRITLPYAIFGIVGVLAATGACHRPAEPAQPSSEPTTYATRANLPAYVVPSVAPAPAAVVAGTKDEAVDAVIRYFDLVNFGFAHNDADPIRQMTTLECAPCLGFIKAIEQHKQQGSTQRGGHVRLVGMRGGAPQDGGFFFRASLLRETGTLTAKDGTIQSIEEQAELVDFVIAPLSGLDGKKIWTLVTMAPVRE